MTQAAPAPQPPLAVNPDEAALMSGHTRSGIYKAIACGDLLSFKSGRRRLILVKELDAWLNRLAKENSR